MSTRILVGDARERLRELAENSVHCVVTSPPYYGLRDYQTGTWEGGDPACEHANGGIPQVAQTKHPNAAASIVSGGNRGGGKTCVRCGAVRVDKQIGLEESPDEYAAALVEVFREVRRVLRDDGTCWLVIGDSYNSGAQYNHAAAGMHAGDRYSEFDGTTWPGHRRSVKNLKHKDLIGIPWLVAFALRADGWWLRQGIIWSKTACMPESIRDRCTTSHEYVFLLAKSGGQTYWTHRDHAGSRVRPPPDYRWIHRDTGEERATAPVANAARWQRVNLWEAHAYFFDGEAIAEPAVSETPAGNGHKRDERINHGAGSATRRDDVGGTRRPRSVWHINPEPYKDAHYAVMPTELARRCIAAGTSYCGCCPGCGAPYEAHIANGDPDRAWQRACGGDAAGGYSGAALKDYAGAGVQNASDVKRRILAGMRVKGETTWFATCGCDAGDPVPALVLDPFAGAGTTLLVADRLGRNAVGIELSDKFAAMAEQRLVKDGPLFAEVETG